MGAGGSALGDLINTLNRTLGEIQCRGCHGENLYTALDLGNVPIANELTIEPTASPDLFPLHLKICSDCGLGQVADVVTPERIFRDYRYLSSVSSTFLDHAAAFVDKCLSDKLIAEGDWVLEIASNDGYLLKNFQRLGIKSIGIEPAKNVAKIAIGLGIHTISEFFGSELAKSIVRDFGHPKLIIANNVMAHVPDLADFIEGLSLLSGPETIISIENPSLANILIGMQFDTIYHEHYSYLTAYSVKNLIESYGLTLIKVENLNTHGGSNRYWIKKSDSVYELHESVELTISTELSQGLFSEKHWSKFSIKVSGILSDFSSWLEKNRSPNVKIYGYGAAAKASTILNSIDNIESNILAIADASLEKQGRYMAPHNIKVVSPQALFDANPTHIIIFPWNIKNEIVTFLRAGLKNNARIWCVIPIMHEVDLA